MADAESLADTIRKMIALPQTGGVGWMSFSSAELADEVLPLLGDFVVTVRRHENPETGETTVGFRAAD